MNQPPAYARRPGLLLALLLCGCATPTPTSRIHNAATVPRLVDVDPGAFQGEGGRPSHVGVNAGAGYGIGFTDSGNVVGGKVVHVGVNYRIKHFAVGVTPYWAGADTNLEGTGVFGYTTWMGTYFSAGDFHFSFQGSFTAANKVNQETGCNASFFATNCTGQPTSSVRVQTMVQDAGAIFTVEKHLGDDIGRHSIFFAPGIYYTAITTGNQLDVNPAGDYALGAHFWSPGAELGFVARFGPEKFPMLASFLAGAYSVKTFRYDLVKRELMPTVDARFQF